MKVRKLNSLGLQEFKKFLEQARAGVNNEIPLGLLSDSKTSDSIDIDLKVPDKKFKSRYEIGDYLVELFKSVSINRYIGDAGFWDWFSLLWFAQICPVKDGALNPSMHYNYCLSANYTHRPRHAVYLTWQLVNRYQDDAKFILSKLDQRGDIAEQLMARQEYLGCEGVMRLASKLYFDPIKGFKKGAAGGGAGSVRRYIAFLQQIERNYYLYLISQNQLLDLLPSEFSRFFPPSKMKALVRSKSPILKL